MSFSYQILNPLSVENWDDLLSQHSDGTFFHTQCWARVMSDTYGYEPKYFSVYSGDKLCFLLPIMEIKSLLTGRRGVSLPFTDYVKPLSFGQETGRDIWAELVLYAKKSKWKHIDLRGDTGACSAREIYESYYRHDVRLTNDTDQLFSRFSNNNKRNIKKAVREGVEIEFRYDMEAVDIFYHLNSITRKRHGIPSQPYRFFENIYKHITSEKKGLVVLAKKDKKTVAGAVYLLFGESAIYKYGASNTEASRLGANNLVMWEAIKWLSDRGYNNLSMGRTGKSNEGLLRYKKGWASEQKETRYYRYNLKEDAFVSKMDTSEPVSLRFFKTAPVSVSNIIGRVLYRHVG